MADMFDELVETFRLSGLSEAAARHAAIGRNRSEREAREAWGESQQGEALADVLPSEGTDLPLIERARIRLKATAMGYLKMPRAEAQEYANRHCERALRRGSEQDAVAYLVEFAEALREIPRLAAKVAGK